MCLGDCFFVDLPIHCQFSIALQNGSIEADYIINLYIFSQLVACEYFGMYRTRSHVMHAVGFFGGPKFEASVHRLNPLATGPHNNL